MPVIGSSGDKETYRIAGSNFTFSGARVTRLGATEYTLVTIAVDVTGSTAPFSDELRKTLIAAVNACRKSSRSDNLLIRVITFSTGAGPDGIRELHGFKLLADIDSQKDYPAFNPNGMTPLFDATYSAIGAMLEYGAELHKPGNDYLVNGICFIITDGDDNASITTPSMIRSKIEQARKDEQLESLVTVLIDINAAQFRSQLDRFFNEAGLTQHVDVGDATPQRLAKLAEFVSQSVSSTSQALSSGGPSKSIAATI